MSVVEIGRETNPGGFLAGHGTVGTDAATVSTVGVPVLKHVVVRADSDNSGTITVGSTSANATNGFILNAGEQTPPVYVDDVEKIWLIGSDADQNYSWLAS